MREPRRNGIRLRITIIIMCGVIASLSCAAMWVSGSFNLNRFCNIEAYDVTKAEREALGVALQYVEQKAGVINVTETEAVKRIDIKGAMVPWQTLVLDLDEMNREHMVWEINFLDKQGNQVYTQEVQLTEGENVVELPKEKFAAMEIRIYEQTGSEFLIRKMQLLKGDKIVKTSQYLGTTVIFFIIYLLVVYVCSKVWKKRKGHGKASKNLIYVFNSKLQDIYLKAGSMLPNWGEKYSQKSISMARRILLLGMLYYMLVINNRDTYFNPQYFLRHVVIWAIFLITTGALCKEGNLRKLRWNVPFAGVWTVFFIWVCISEFLVKKRLCGWGYLMLFAAGFLFFMWGNMKKPEQFQRDIVKAIEWFSVINLVFCLISRPRIEGLSYQGIAWNPNIYAQYLMPMAVVFFAEADAWILKRQKGKICFYAAMTGCCYYLGWISQSRTVLLSLAAVLIVFIIKQMRNVAMLQAKKRVLIFMTAVCVIGVPAAAFSNWCINNIAEKLETQIVFPRDDYKIEVKVPSLKLEVQAMETGIRESRVVRKLVESNDMESITSGRNLYWKAYLRDMNLWGHEYQLEIWGAKRGEHSGFITIAYRYGVFAIIPYLLIIGYLVRYSWHYMKKQKHYAFYPIGITMGMICILLVENVERPFYSVACLAFWLLPGFFMNCNSEKKEKDRENIYVEEQ